MLKTPEEILAEAQKVVRAETELLRARCPVEYDPIRRYCHMTDDDNPLFLDPEYAKSAGFRDAVCPPLFIGYFASQGIWPKRGHAELRPPLVPTAGDRAINLSTEWEFYEPVQVGDWLSYKKRIAEVYIKSIRIDPKAFWIREEMLVFNQAGEMVAKLTNLGLRHRTPEQIREAGE